MKTKVLKRPPRIMQQNLAKRIKFVAENGIKTTRTQLLQSVGYSKNTAYGNAHKILNSEGLKQALKAEGISLENSDNVVKSILNSPIVYEMVTPDNQLRAADYIAKRLGGFQDQGGNKTLNINIFSPEQAQEIAKRLLGQNTGQNSVISEPIGEGIEDK